MRTMRRALVAGAAAALGGCNMVVTNTPMFAPSDADPALALREGVWNSTTDKACAFDDSAPLEAWPACASGSVVTATQVRSLQSQKDGTRTQTSTGYVLVNGDPPVMQIPIVPTDKIASPPVAFIYIALKPTSTDAKGRITAFSTWPVLCGPPPKADLSKGGEARLGTREPLPGLVMEEAGSCRPTSVAALRRAAAASQAWADTPGRSRWVRDGER